MNTKKTINFQSGAVSLFMVIFAMLLMGIVTISFLRIMTSDQRQASDNDLSQSAYDSAIAGVEDAKRALLWHAELCKTDPSSCDTRSLQMATDQCNAAIRLAGVVKDGDYSDTAGGVGTGEVKIQQSTVTEGGESIDAALDQAYTCVTLTLNTPDYTATLLADESKLIPLVSTEPFNSITIEWFRRDNAPGAAGSLNIPAVTDRARLLTRADWPSNRPAVMRAQYMQVGDNFTLTGFDTTTDAGESNSNTLFLYPASAGLPGTTEFGRDARRTESGTGSPALSTVAPTVARCANSVGAKEYACSITIQLPTPIGGGNAAAAYLRLTPLYKASDIRVTLSNGLFKSVQPKVDSTGRANDLFRRVESRIDMYDTSFPYPDAALSVDGNVCKDFGVTDTTYLPGTCAP